ncbi:MAG: ATP-binding cassette domain-containing protein [Deferribacteraceae bacterium]|jgi:ATP-binding cassette subfamily F protein 3|nr:ATP-binding cassette domain-containing protein [Deferribacteraceae bacterium]
MLSLTDITKSYGSHKLFERVTFTLNSGDRFGLVGRNGHGKSTLIKIIAGMESAERGTIITPRGYSMGYLSQTPLFSENSVEKEGLAALNDGEQDYIARKILFGLGFTAEQLSVHPCNLSGGFQIRLMLAKLLIKKPNLLLLDEPTNFLDILSVRWLKAFLQRFQGELILITHDRAFMDDVITHTMGIHRGFVKVIKGETKKYYDAIAQEEEVYEKTRLNEQAKRKDMEIYISRFRAKARLANLVQSRLKRLAKMEKREKLSKIDELDFSFKYKPIVSKTFLQAISLAFGYDDKPLFKNLAFTLSEGDRICVIGKNGLGKSSLLKVLAGFLEPKEGEILKHSSSKAGYYAQDGLDSTLSANNTVEEEVAKSAGYILERSAVRRVCAALLFSGEDALKRISLLSGGERSRVALAKLAVIPQSYLMLDEPTNHLDMDASDALLEALDNFEGPIIAVTHNEAYLYALANKLIVFQGETPFLFEGGYAEFLEKVGFSEEEKKPPKPKKEGKRLRAEIIGEKSRTLNPLKERIAFTENKICACEELEKSLIQDMQTATERQSGRELSVIGAKLREVKEDMDACYEELNRLFIEYDEKERRYNLMLEDCR